MILSKAFSFSSTALSTALLATAGLSIAPIAVPTAQAASSLFSEQSVNASQFVVMAAPRNDVDYNLVVLEQKSSSRDCWTESNGVINPLLLNFDFSGICGRATDSNGYSIRMAGEDLGLQYSLRLEDRGDYVALMAAPNRRNQSSLEIGRTQNAAKDFLAVDLNPGWNLSRRVYDGKALGHIYFSNETSLANTVAAAPAPAARPVTPKPVVTKPVATKPVTTPSKPDAITIGQPLPKPPVLPGSNQASGSIPIAVEQAPVAVVEDPATASTATPIAVTTEVSPSTDDSLSSQPHYSALNPLYQEILGREVDPAGLATYGKKLDQGKSLSWVSDRLRSSKEGEAVAIKRLYREVLGREADAGGLRTYGKRLARGWNLSQVRSDLANSKEARQRLANR